MTSVVEVNFKILLRLRIECRIDCLFTKLVHRGIFNDDTTKSKNGHRLAIIMMVTVLRSLSANWRHFH